MIILKNLSKKSLRKKEFSKIQNNNQVNIIILIGGEDYILIYILLDNKYSLFPKIEEY